MMKRAYRRWTEEEHEFAKQNYLKMTLNEISERLGRSRGCVFNHLKAKGIIREQGPTWFWTEERMNILRERYHNTYSRELAEIIGTTTRAVTAKAGMMGLRKDPEFMIEARKIGQFKKGHVPATKGRKMEDFLPPDAYHKILQYRFKKGHTLTPSAPLGYERINHDGFIQVKVGHRKWRYKHRLVWEERHGPISNQDIILFKDGNKQNCDISNLYRTTYAEIMKHNGINRYPPELRKLILVQCRLQKLIEKQTKNE